MAHHAYVTEGNADDTIARARAFAADQLSIHDPSSPDILTYSFGHLSVEDTRRILDVAYQTGSGEHKVIVLYANRLFHEAQNALLKVMEEPPDGVVLITGVPSKGVLLPTLRSRLIDLPARGSAPSDTVADSFMKLSAAEREKYIGKLLDRTKSDKDEAKNAARTEALELVQGLTRRAYGAFHTETAPKKREELQLLLEDLDAFAPLMHERATPFKLIFEHLLLVLPEGL
jgi:DNA polymerase III delta prime subunit